MSDWTAEKALAEARRKRDRMLHGAWPFNRYELAYLERMERNIGLLEAMIANDPNREENT